MLEPKKLLNLRVEICTIMKILSNNDIKAIEQRTLKSQNIQTFDLIERVAEAVASEVKLIANREQPLIVLAGWGNNGADALATSHILALEGFKPTIYLFNISGNRLNNECVALRERLKSTQNVTLHEITGTESMFWSDPPSNAVIIDGLFGSGLNKPLPRTFQLLARNINESGATVVSIDVPSGLFGEWNGPASRENMIHATVTLAIEFPRLSFMLSDNSQVVGKWKVLRIGYDSRAVKDAPFTYILVDGGMVSRCLPARNPFSSKADFGNSIIFAGKRGMMGSAVLAAKGALRGGAGKVTVYSASEGGTIVQTAVPCAMFRGDSRASYITSMPFDISYDALGVGPGIGTADETANAFEKFVKAASAGGKRLVVDADALNIIAKKPIILGYLTPLSIITPHVAEFDRIFGTSSSDEERLKKALKCAEDYSLIIILKGHHTAIVRPDGKVMFNSTGTPAMATPGSGDVLTGLLVALMGNGLDSEIAAFVAPYIHGLAGEIAARQHGEYGVTAEDIADNIGVAIKQIMDGNK